MTRGVRWSLVGSVVLVTLAGCGRGILHYAQREPWRRDAEVACLQSGAVKEGPGVVRIEPIEGPGICGASMPLKVAMLGEANGSLGYTDEPMRPPGSIAGAAPASQPRWPIANPNNPQAGAPMSISPPGVNPPDASSYPQPAGSPRMIWSEGPPPAAQPDSQGSYSQGTYSQGSYGQGSYDQPAYSQPPAQRAAPPVADNDDDDFPPATQPSVMPASPPPALGPQRAPVMGSAALSVELKPTATLACPIVSALDRWIANSVQPAAQHWFGKQVVEIKQISAYSCRGMNGQPGAHISEHAFGNALDVAAFVLTDGHRITVKDGWHGSPEEQGFLRDVQGAACEQFTTVLAPGSNRFHYDHIHVDLMRRASGRRICQPGAVDGELIASRARKGGTQFAARPFEPLPTRRYDPPFDERNDPFAWRGDAVRRGEPATTGSIKPRGKAAVAEDDDWIEDDGPRPAIDWSEDRHKPR